MNFKCVKIVVSVLHKNLFGFNFFLKLSQKFFIFAITNIIKIFELFF